jgi:hypothetical protein
VELYQEDPKSWKKKTKHSAPFTDEEQRTMVQKHMQRMAERALTRAAKKGEDGEGTNNIDNATTNNEIDNNNSTNNTNNKHKSKKRKLEEILPDTKRMKLEMLIDSGPNFIIPRKKIQGKYGKPAPLVKVNRAKRDKEKYKRRLKRQISIEKRRIDKKRAESASAARTKLRSATKRALVTQIDTRDL